MPGREVSLYTETAQALMARNVKILAIDTSGATPSEVAFRIVDALPDVPIPSATAPNPTTPQGP